MTPRSWCFVPLFIAVVSNAQDRLPSMPGYEKYRTAPAKISEISRQLLRSGGGTFAEAGRIFKMNDGRVYDTSTRKFVENFDSKAEAPRTQIANPNQGRPRPQRGRQFATTFSADGAWIAKHLDGNIAVQNVADPSSKPVQVTTEGVPEKRIKYGTGSWVYGEELGQIEAMWWSPDAKKLAYYRFDDSEVKDFYLTLGERGVQNRLYTEAYPKAGTPNPKVELHVWDQQTKKRTKIDTTFSTGDPDAAHYVYGIQWAPTGELLFHRTNRKQNQMEWCAANPSTGACRVVVKEANPAGWTENTPAFTWLENKQQFIWNSEKSGFNNLYFGSLAGGELKPITQNKFEVDRIVRVDEKNGTIHYLARSAPNPYHVQLHSIKFDGSSDRRLTNPQFNHTIQLAESGWFTDTYQSITSPPGKNLCDPTGKVVEVLEKAQSDPYAQIGMTSATQFVCKAADGVTDIYGYYRRPSNFDRTKKYPVILFVYGGPESGTNSATYLPPDPVCELGFITAWIDGRGTEHRGREFRQAVYRKLGVVEIDDMAAAVKHLATMPFVDGSRVGIEGTSYGGYASVLAILRHPGTFAAACASSAVTSWHHYDTIYTERYLDTPQNNPEGYKAGSAMEFAKQLKGSLCLFYGTADDNVHPSNTHNLIAALDSANKPYRLYVGVDQGHSGLRRDRMMEFFIDSLKP